MKTQKEKLIDILSIPIHPRIGADYTEVVADYLLYNDVLPVVRCKDCVHARKLKDNFYGWEYSCKHFNSHSTRSNDFCSYGERRNV